MPKLLNLMESYGDGSIFLGRGMSRALKRAKEHQKRSSDELVMDETRIQPCQFQGYPDIREEVRMIRVRQGRFCCLGVRTSGRGSS